MKLAIIILSGDTPEMLFLCLNGLRESVKVEYKIYLAYNGSDASVEGSIRNFLQVNFNEEQYKFVKYDFYNFAILNNDIVRKHLDPEYGLLLFCNNDVIVQGDVVNRMVQVMLGNPGRFGTIGCRLLFEDGKIQHDGQLLCVWKDGRFRKVGHWNLFMNPNELKMPDRLVIGNTFALCLTSLELFNAIGGLNEKYKKCFEDVEYNLLCVVAGRSNLILESKYYSYHLESYSRSKSEGGALLDPDDLRILMNLTYTFANSNRTGEHPLLLRTEESYPGG